MAKDKEETTTDANVRPRKRSSFSEMLFSDFGIDESDAYVANEEALDKGGKPVHKFTMSSLGLVRKRVSSLVFFLRRRIDWMSTKAVMMKIPSISYEKTGDFIVKKTVTWTYRPGKEKILKWFGQILINPNNMYSEEVRFAFIRAMTERGMHIVSFCKDTKGRLVSVTFDFTCIQKGGVWAADAVETDNVIDDNPDVQEVAVEDADGGEEIPEDEIDDDATEEGNVDETSEPITTQA